MISWNLFNNHTIIAYDLVVHGNIKANFINKKQPPAMNLHLDALVFLLGITSIDLVFDLPIILGKPSSNHHHYYSNTMPSFLAKIVIPVLVAVLLLGITVQAFNKRSFNSITSVFLIIFGSAFYVINEIPLEDVYPLATDPVLISETSAKIAWNHLFLWILLVIGYILNKSDKPSQKIKTV